MRFKKISSIAIAFLILLIGKNAFAFETQYSVQAILPDNQIDDKVSYFALKVKPNQKQELSLLVHNSSNEAIDVELEPHNASTNQNGLIVYEYQKKIDDSLKVPFTQLISEAQSVHLESKESKVVDFELNMPKEYFDGIILGGFRIYQKYDDKENKDSGVQLNNRIEYEMSVKLVETDVAVVPNINLLDAYAGLDNYVPSFFATLQNDQATVINNLSIEAKVFFKDEKSPLYELKKDDLRMAPNSNFDFPIGTANKAMKPGKYSVKILAKADDKEWKLSKEFLVKSDEAKKINDEAVGVIEDEQTSPTLIVLSTVVVCSIIFLLAYLIRIKLRKDRRRE